MDIDRWQEIATTMGRNKLRTLLTALGVFWGIFMLILMLGFGSGLENGVSRMTNGMATNSIMIWGSETSIPYQGLPAGRRIKLRNADADVLKTHLPDIERASPRVRLGGYRGANTVVRGSKTAAFTVTGVRSDYAKIAPMNLEAGRFLNLRDNEKRRKVAVVGSEVHKKLYETGEEAIGTHLAIRGVQFQVIGMFSVLSGGHGGDRQANTIFIPLTTFQEAFNYDDRIDSIAVTAKHEASAAAVENQIRTILRDRHSVSPDDGQAIRAWNMGAEFNRIRSVLAAIQSVIWFVGIFTLLAGVIGVSNIMLIAVKERTKEIGLRKALGARPLSIVAMVLQEALVLTTLAGYLGMVAGVGLVEVVGSVMARGQGSESAASFFADPSVSIEAALISTIVLIIAGVLAGILPARHAAAIQPVVALRAE